MPSGGPIALGAGSTMTGNDVWRLLRANIWSILLVMIVFLGAGAALNQFVLKPYFSRFTSSGFVKISILANTDPTKGNGEEELGDPGRIGLETRSTALLLKSDGLLSDFLSTNPEVQKTDWYHKFEVKNAAGQNVPDTAKAKASLEDSLSVSAQPETSLIQVAMTAPNPQDARTIVTELVNMFLREQQAYKQSRTSARSAELNRIRNEVQRRSTLMQEDLRRLQQELNRAGYKTSTQGGQSQKEIELTELLRKQLDSNADLSDATQMLQSMQEAMQRGETPSQVESMMAQDQRVFQAKLGVDSSERELQAIQSMMGEKHPRAEIAKKALDLAKRQHEDAQSETRSRMINQFMGSAQSQVSSEKVKYDGLTERINSIRTELGDLDFKVLQAMVYQDQQKAYADQIKDIEEQLNVIRVGTEVRTGVDWARLPEIPKAPSFPKLWLTLSAAGAMGLLLSLGIAFLRELMDTSVRSPRDITRIGQISILGMIQHEDDDPQVVGVPLPMVIYQAPTSMIAEQFRQVRSRLQHSTSLDSTRTLLVTSPSPSDGKSTVASNIAAGLALNGRRILLVDANFRRPELHKIYNVSNDMGFSSVFSSLENLPLAAKQTSIPNLDVLPTGPKPANATELLESSLFTDFIDKALLEYDHIIFDSGPLLFVSETVAMAPRVDGVVTVVRASANSRGLLQRLRDQLKSLKAEHLGVVLNGVRVQGGGYYGRNIKTYYEYSNGHKN